MACKFDGYYTYQNDPISSYFRIDKKYNFEYFEGRTLTVLEIPETSDFHCQIERPDKTGRRGVWLRADNITPDECADIYNNASNRVAFQKMYDEEFPDVEVAFCGFCMDNKRWPTYGVGKRPYFMLTDIFVNGKWMDHDIVMSICERHKLPTLPVVFTGAVGEDDLRTLLGTPSKHFKGETIHNLYVKLQHESIDDKWVTTRKGVTIIGPKEFVSTYDYSKKNKVASAKKETDEDDVSELELIDLNDEHSKPLETPEEINDFINKVFGEEVKPEDKKVIPINGKIGKKPLISPPVSGSLEDVRTEILRNKIDEIFNSWKAYANNILIEFTSKDEKPKKRDFIFSAGPFLTEAFKEYIKKDARLVEIYARMIRYFGEKTVAYEIQTKCYKYVGSYLGL